MGFNERLFPGFQIKIVHNVDGVKVTTPESQHKAQKLGIVGLTHRGPFVPPAKPPAILDAPPQRESQRAQTFASTRMAGARLSASLKAPPKRERSGQPSSES